MLERSMLLYSLFPRELVPESLAAAAIVPVSISIPKTADMEWAPLAFIEVLTGTLGSKRQFRKL